MLKSLYTTVILLVLFSSTVAALHRRILHQTFFPQDSFPPSPPPVPSPPPLPFSNSTPSTNDTPFFPSYPSPPPPPSPASFASFPANISSITVPNSKPNFAPSKLITVAAASVAAAVAIVCLAVFLHLRKQRSSSPLPPSSYSSKIQRSDNPSTTASVATAPPSIPKLQRPSQTSSEFLYLGTLVSSLPTNTGIGYNNNTRNDGSASSNSRKPDSPELRPLPPLKAQQGQQQNLRTADVASSKDDDESFYSPKGSSIGTGSASRGAFTFAAVQQADNFRRSTSNSSSSYSSSVSGSGSGSPVRSLSLSPANSASPINYFPKSPDLIEIQTITPLHHQTTSALRNPVLEESPHPSPSPPSSSPERYSRSSHSRSSHISSPRFSNVESPVKNSRPVRLIPTPPPPPPPPQRPAYELPPPPPPPPPPALITPFRPIVIGNPTFISPIESLPLPSKNLDSESPYKVKEEDQNEETTPKLKLKPLHWDKVRASSDREMVWDQLKCSSFKLNEEMIETLFVVNTPKPSPKEVPKWQVLPSPGIDNGDRVLDPKKAQNISILLRALNVTVEEVCEGLLDGNKDALGTELLESLLKMAPSKEEERKLKEYKDDSPVKLGVAEKFLKAVLDIPNAFKRVDAMLYVSNFDSEVEYLRKSFETLEVACEELRTSRMFLKLLEAVLKTGNRMNVGTNRGGAHAFKLDTLLKLVDVKGADGKTTLLHFVVQEITRSEGSRLSSGTQLENPSLNNDDVKCRKLGLKVVSALSSELSNVKKSAAMDAEVLSSDVSKLSKGIMNIAEVARLNESTSLTENGSGKFSDSMKCFMKKGEEEIIRIQAQESVALSLVKEVTEYFHGNSAKEEAHPFRIFMVVRDFLIVLDRVCKEVGMINDRTIVSSGHKFPVPINPMLQSGSGGFPNRRLHSSSDEEGSSSP